MTYYLRQAPLPGEPVTYPELKVDERTGPVVEGDHPIAWMAEWLLHRVHVWYPTPTSVGLPLGWDTPAVLAAALTEEYERWGLGGPVIVAYNDKGGRIDLPPFGPGSSFVVA